MIKVSRRNQKIQNRKMPLEQALSLLVSHMHEWSFFREHDALYSPLRKLSY